MKLLRKRNTKQVIKTKPSAATTTAPVSPPKTAAAVPSLVEWQVADYNRRFGSNTNNNKSAQKKENTNTTSASSSPAAAADAVLEVSSSANAEDVKNLLESLQAVDSASVADTSYTSAALTRNTTYTSVATNALTQNPSYVTSTAGISVFQDMESYATSYDSNDRLTDDGSTEVSLASTSYAESSTATGSMASSSVATNEYEARLGKSFRLLKLRMDKHTKDTKEYDDKIGKSFRNLQRSLMMKRLPKNLRGKKSATKKSQQVVVETTFPIQEEQENEEDEEDDDVSFLDGVSAVFDDEMTAVETVVEVDMIDEAAAEDASFSFSIDNEDPIAFSIDNEDPIDSKVPSVAASNKSKSMSMEEQELSTVKAEASATAIPATIVAATTTRTLVEDINLEPNIEAVKQGESIILGFYQPSEEDLAEEEEEVFDFSAAAYNLSVMIDGVVVTTVAIGAAGMELLSMLVTIDSSNDDNVPVYAEEECVKGTITPILPAEKNDILSENAQVQTDGTVPEPDQSVIHPMIKEKVSSFFGNSAETDQEVKVASTSDDDVILASNNDDSLVEKSWLETGMDKVRSWNTSSSAVEGGACPEPEEDTRNDYSNPALEDGEVRQDEPVC